MIRAVAFAVALLLILPLLASRPPAPGTRKSAPAGELLVILDAATWQRGPYAAEQLLEGQIIETIPEVRTVRLAVVEDEPAEAAMTRIRRLPGVEHVEPNLRLRGAGPADDTFYGGQAGYLELIEAPAAWDITPGSPSVIVAVLDTGIDLTHPDLAGKVWTNPYESIDGDDEDGNGCVDDVHGCNAVSPVARDPSCDATAPGDVRDDNGHGTFVAGIIAAAGNNGIGVTGAAPGVTVMPVKILDCLGGGSAADAARGILYAARNGARVANISFSSDGESIVLASAIRQAHDRYGMVIVAASGSSGEERVTFPARLPETIAVGASGAPEGPNLRAQFSNWGPEVDVVAPGLDILSTVPLALCGRWHCLNDGPYANASGTSFAAPLVSSLAALIISRHPNLNPETVRGLITRSAVPLSDANSPRWDGAGRIRMRAALALPRYQIGAPGVMTGQAATPAGTMP